MVNKLYLTYQPGKVASMSIHTTLRKFVDAPVKHFHRLNLRHFNLYLEIMEHVDSSGDYSINRPKRNQLKKRKYSESLVTLLRLLMLRIRYLNNKNCEINIVTPVREPISRNISAFFENINIIDPDYMKKNVEELVDLFYTRFNHSNILNWFDYEFKSVFGLNLIDPRDFFFDKAKGYSIHSRGRLNVLVLRIEDLDHNYKEAFDAFGLDIPSLVLENITDKKKKAHLYSEFKKNIKINEGYINHFLESAYTKKFYRENDITLFKDKYLARLT